MMFSKKYLEDAKCELETALDPEEEVKFEEAPVQSPQPEPLLKPYVANGAPLNLVSNTCICILQSGTRKGQECGKPVKANNRCGTHQKKCIEQSKLVIIPEPVQEKAPEPVQEKAPEPVQEKAPEPIEEKAPEPIEEKAPEPIEEKLSDTCICILQSGVRKGQECGKPVKANNRCGTHQKKCIEPEKVQVEKVSKQISTCPCVIQSGKNKGQVCGKTVIEGTVRCKSHKNACILPETESKTELEPVEPVELLEPEPVVQGQLDPDQYEESKEPVEPIVPPEPIETSDWLVVPVTKKELVRILQTTPIVDIDVEQLNILENEILKCFSV